MDIDRVHSNRGTVTITGLFSPLRVLLVCCALSQCATGSSIQQLVENTEPPSKAGTQCEHHQSKTHALQSGAAPNAQSGTQMRIPDVEVIDQYGKRMRFYTDLVKGKVVVINFIYTTCTYICPMQGASFSRLQAALGDRIGKDVYLISVTTDPLTDTPEKLKAWGQKFEAKQGWRLVTGQKTQMDKLLLALTGDSVRQGEHSAIAIIGSDDKDRWVRTYGLEGPQRMIEIIDSIVNRPTAEVEPDVFERTELCVTSLEVPARGRGDACDLVRKDSEVIEPR